MERPAAGHSDDAHILEGIRRGDEDALVTLFRSNRRPITTYILRNSGTMDDAEDMLQEALVVLWERVRAGRYELTAKLDTFVFATVRNLWLRRLSRSRRESPSVIDTDAYPAGDASPLDLLVESEEAAVVRDALSRLGEPCRTLLILFYWEEASMDDIAVRLGFANADTAKSKKYQCKKALERLLKRHDESNTTITAA